MSEIIFLILGAWVAVSLGVLAFAGALHWYEGHDSAGFEPCVVYDLDSYREARRPGGRVA